MNRTQRLLARLFKLPMLSGSVSNVVIRGHTGRRIAVDRDFYHAQKLAQRSRLGLLWSSWAWRVARELRKAPLVAPSTLVLLRARPYDNSIHGWEQMGPPPVSRAPAGRYNLAGTSVLYLSTSEEGVRLEVPGPRLCIQQYNIDVTPLRVADFTSEEATNLLHAAFDLAEKACVPGWSVQANYTFSQFLAQGVQRSGFDGFRVPGVRGNSSVRYHNVVLLRPEGRWPSWSTGQSGFRQDLVGEC